MLYELQQRTLSSEIRQIVEIRHIVKIRHISFFSCRSVYRFFGASSWSVAPFISSFNNPKNILHQSPMVNLRVRSCADQVVLCRVRHSQFHSRHSLPKDKRVSIQVNPSLLSLKRRNIWYYSFLCTVYLYFQRECPCINYESINLDKP